MDLTEELIKQILVLNFEPDDIRDHGYEILAQIHYEGTINNVNWIPE